MKQSTLGERQTQAEANDYVDCMASADFLQAQAQALLFRAGEGCQCENCGQQAVTEFNQAADFWYQGEHPEAQLFFAYGKVLTSEEIKYVEEGKWE